MNDKMITELVRFKLLGSTTEAQLLSKAQLLNDFHKKQDGYIDCELVKDVNEESWYFIYHYECLEKVMKVGEKLCQSKAFDEFMPLLVPDSVNVSFYKQLKKW